MNFQYLNRHKELIPSAIGISSGEFIHLLYLFSSYLRIQETSWYKQDKRKRKRGGGRHTTLNSDAKKLLFILFYYKNHPTYRVCQILFELDKKNCRVWKLRLECVLHKLGKQYVTLPAFRTRVAHAHLWLIPALKECIVDGTERPVKRSVNTIDQEQFYSGKKKYHTVKNVILIDPHTNHITGVTRTCLGKTHDLEVFRTDNLFFQIPRGSVGLADSGFQGTNHPFLRMIIPDKKTRGSELSSEQRQANTQISKRRVAIEHVFAHLKKYKILSEPLRDKLLTPDNLTPAHIPFETIAGLYNFHLTYVRRYKTT